MSRRTIKDGNTYRPNLFGSLYLDPLYEQGSIVLTEEDLEEMLAYLKSLQETKDET